MMRQRPLFFTIMTLLVLYTRHTTCAFQSVRLHHSKRPFSTLFSASSRPQTPSRTFPLNFHDDIRGVIFDMDGTLVKPCIDFGEMRRRIYRTASQDLGKPIDKGCVLELADTLSEQGQLQASRIFHEIESDAIEQMTVMNGMVELCTWLDDNEIKRGLLTRNVERSVEALHDMIQPTLSPFSPAVARNTLDPFSQETILPKPHPDAIHYICTSWNCLPSQVVMVGDSLKDDVVAANRAGCISVFLDMGKDNCSGNEDTSTLEEREPSLTVSSLRELQELLVARQCSSFAEDEDQVAAASSRG